MTSFVEVSQILLKSMGYAIYNYFFISAVILIAFFTMRFSKANVYSVEKTRSNFQEVVDFLLQGIVFGIVGSFAVTWLGIPLQESIYLLMLLPISLGLGMISMRFMSLSYAGVLIGLLSLIFSGQTIAGIEVYNIQVDMGALLAFVSLFTLLEGVALVFLKNHYFIPIIAKKNQKLVMGYMVQKFWPIPMAVLMMSSQSISGSAIPMPGWWPLLKGPSYMLYAIMLIAPMVGILQYSTITFTSLPEKRVKQSGFVFIGVSTITLIIAFFIGDGWLQGILSIALMICLQEIPLWVERYQEVTKEPIYELPQIGVRIMHVLQDSIANEMGLSTGDVISEVNAQEIKNTRHFRAVLNQGKGSLWIKVKRPYGECIELSYNKFMIGADNLGVVLMPENPPIIFRHEHMRRLGLIHLFQHRLFTKKK